MVVTKVPKERFMDLLKEKIMMLFKEDVLMANTMMQKMQEHEITNIADRRLPQEAMIASPIDTNDGQQENDQTNKYNNSEEDNAIRPPENNVYDGGWNFSNIRLNSSPKDNWD